MAWNFEEKTPALNDAFESMLKHLIWMQEILPEIFNDMRNKESLTLDDLKEGLLKRAREEKISTALVPVLIGEILRRLESGEIKGKKIEDKPSPDDDSDSGKTNSSNTDGEEDPNNRPQPDPELSPQPDSEPSPQPDSEPSPQPDPELSPQPDPEPSPQPDPEPSPQPDPEPSPRPDPENGNKKKRKGGRKAGQRNLVPADFTKSVTVFVNLDSEVKPGSFCPCCHEKALEATRGAELIRYGASCPLPVTRVMVEKSRCKACGQHFEAEMPQDWRREICIGNFTPNGVAMSILMRYGLGFPDLRLETLQGWCETPLSNSTQWTASLTLWESLLPLWNEFFLFAANADQRQLDDCTSRIISHKKEIKEELALAGELGLSEKQVRTGIQSTVVIATKDGVTIRLVVSGRQHQGEVEFELANSRTVDTPVINITDAASKSESIKEFPGKNDLGFVPSGSPAQKSKSESTTGSPRQNDSGCTSSGATAQDPKENSCQEEPAKDGDRIQANCLEHLRQTIEKAQPGFMKEISFFIENLCEVFKLERQSKNLNHSAEERLDWHQTYSLPLLKKMKDKAEQELESNKKAEPNSEYAKALKYFLNHYAKLTAFTSHHDIPLTTSLAECGAKFTKLHLKNSLGYQTERGSQVGDSFMSVIATCMGMDVNPLEYLEALARWRSEITAETAADWLPHRFREAEKAAKQRYEMRESKAYRLRPRKTKKEDGLDVPHLKSEPSMGDSSTVRCFH